MLNTALLILANILVGILLAEFVGLKRDVKEVREKLHEHIEDYSLHGLSRPIETHRP